MENNEKKTNEQEENEKTGKLSGLGAGVITGAAIGLSCADCRHVRRRAWLAVWSAVKSEKNTAAHYLTN